jgi:hypothetical protein
MNKEIINTTILNKNSIDDFNYVENLITLGKYYKMSNYLLPKINKIMLYLIILDFENENEYLIHIGYTKNIFDRLKYLKYEYKCETYLIKCKEINNKIECNKFNSSIKITYPNLVIKNCINNKQKKKIYKASHLIINEFDKYSYEVVYEFKRPYDVPTYEKMTLILVLKHEIIKRNYKILIDYGIHIY